MAFVTDLEASMNPPGLVGSAPRVTNSRRRRPTPAAMLVGGAFALVWGVIVMVGIPWFGLAPTGGPP